MTYFLLLFTILRRIPKVSRLVKDSDGPLDEKLVEAQYGLMQQLVPGEMLAPQKLAMGQTYEQLDRNETGRLGEKGQEKVSHYHLAESISPLLYR